ncbi:hypothetical protein OGAPHI_006933 [Ogataea philodendri]|uniref:Uncharacterized protein n=1 Tax=Ogataea philodendri TaxID=1378263 RepID=A0A9P8NVE5_9ASCO|nr:uncharacterized protein OGAPHI_006933 [Ogataea philodendri]KAH3660347.1 hypothetical protein OGAPHI_006933 [Ogataea philodendri]
MDWFRKKSDEDSLELRKSQTANSKLKLTDLLYNGGKFEPEKAPISGEGERKAGEFSAELNRQLREKEERILRNKRIRSRPGSLVEQKENISVRPVLELEKVELNELKRRVTKLEGSLEDAKLRNGLLERKLGEEKRQYEQRNRELEVKERDLKSKEAQQEARIERLQKVVHELRHKTERLEAEKSMLESRARESDRLERKLESLESMNSRLEKSERAVSRSQVELQRANHKLSLKEEECEELLAANTQLKRRLQNFMDEQNRNKDLEIRRLRAQLNKQDVKVPVEDPTLDTAMIYKLSLNEIIAKQTHNDDSTHELFKSTSLIPETDEFASTTALFNTKPAENTDYLLSL